MANNESGPRDAAKGITEDVKGKVKEAAGALTGNDDMTHEGRAQQDKAAARREAAKREAEAEKARAEARAHEVEERSYQD